MTDTAAASEGSPSRPVFRRRFLHWGAFAVALILAAIAGSANLGLIGAREVVMPISADSWIRGPGNMFYVSVPELSGEADSNEEPDRSQFHVLEDGARLGPPHSQHADISSQGLGRYSHYSDYFYISSSDNTDVIINGRSYTLMKSPTGSGLPEAALWAAAGFFAFVGLGLLLAQIIAARREEGAKQAPSLSRRDAVAIFAIVLLLVVGIAAAVVTIQKRAVTIDLPNAGWSAAAGHMYVYPLPELEEIADSNPAPAQSPYGVLENGLPLGPAHSGHSDIINSGQGRFSHFSAYIYISARDNSDVRTNGRTYQLARMDPPNLKPSLALVALSALIFAVMFGPRLARRMHESVAVVLLNLLTAALAFVVVWSATGIERSMAIDVSAIAAGSGSMYYVALPDLEPNADSPGKPFGSGMRVFEDGVELGPSHANHTDIIGSGGGRFSHYGAGLLFSASDNSDPRSNDRAYSVNYPIFPELSLVGALIAMWFAVLVLAAFRRAGDWGGIRAEHIVWGIRSSNLALIGAAAVVAPIFFLLTAGAGGSEQAGVMLVKIRDLSEAIVAPVVAALGAWALAWRRYPGPWEGAGRMIAGAFVVGTVCYGILDRDYGLSDQGPLLLYIVAFALVAGLATRFVFASARGHTVGAFERDLKENARAHVGWAVGICAGLCVVQALPEVVMYWDQSGWMDSHTYDDIAHNIARGSLPYGSDIYPPLYQYGLASVYWTVGHFYFAQQIVNVVLAVLAVVLFALAAWHFFRSVFAVWLAGLFGAHWETMHHASWYTQIEGWYIPVFALSILALAYYSRHRSLPAMALLGVAAALVFATRQQGAFYAAALGLAPLVFASIPWRSRLVHMTAFALVFTAIGILPWSARNYAVEQRFSPSSAQSIEFLAVYNDPRIPFHGIRYWENYDIVRAEWAERYPDVPERRAAMSEYFKDRLIHDTDYFIEAAPFRAAVFYGLLPGPMVMGTGDIGGFERDPVSHFKVIFQRFAPIVLSVLGLLFAIRVRLAWFMVLLIMANLMISFLVGSAEPRICYAVLMLHFVLALAIIAPFPKERDDSARAIAKPVQLGTALGVVTALAVGVVAVHYMVGQHNLYRPIGQARYDYEEAVTIDPALPLVTQADGALQVDGVLVEALTPGQRYRGQFKLSNVAFPPRWSGVTDGIDTNLLRPGSMQYYFTYGGGRNQIPLRFENVIASMELRERMIIDAEFTVDSTSIVYGNIWQVNWARADKAVVRVQEAR